MDKFVKYGALILLLSLFLGFMLGFPSFAIAYIVNPIATLLWAAWRIVSSVHQSVYWVFLLVLCLVLMIRLLPAGKNNDNSEPSSAYPYQHESRSRVERWQILFKDSVSGGDESAALRESLTNLLADMIAQAAPSSPVDLKGTVAPAGLSLPPAVQQYLFTKPTRGRLSSERRRAHLVSWTPNWFRRLIGEPRAPEMATVEELLQWMESFMEVENDR